MRVLNSKIIDRFARKHPDCRDWLRIWIATAALADWHTIQDVKLDYPAVDGGVKVASGLVVTIFDVSGNKYRLVTRINYATQVVTVLEAMKHDEYSKDHWKRRH